MLSVAQHIHLCPPKIKDFCAESALGINERGVCYKLVGRGCTGELKLLRFCDSGDGQTVGNQS